MIVSLKKLIMLWCIVASWAALADADAANYVDRIVAVVNDDIITLSELDDYLRPYAEKIKTSNYPSEQERKMLFTVREQMLNGLIDQKLTDQEIKRADIRVTEAELDNAVERVKEVRFLTDEDLREALKNQGLTIEAYRETIREQILRTRLINLEVKSKIVITQEDIRADYESHPELYGGEKKHHLRNILLRLPPLADDREKQAVYERMQGVVQKIKEGDSFDALARQYSDSPTAADGGDLGAFSLQDLSPQIRDAVKDLRPGEVTGILDTDQGFQMFYLEDIINSPGKSFEDVSGDIHEKLLKEIIDEKFRSWLETLRKKSHIKIIK